jgi:transcriptional regulator with XRE-family HTH domain
VTTTVFETSTALSTVLASQTAEGMVMIEEINLPRIVTRSSLVPAQAPLAPTSFGSELRRLVKASGIVQTELAKRAGISPQCLCNWMAGRSGPSPSSEVIVKVLEAELQTPPNHLWARVKFRSRKGRMSATRYAGIVDNPRKRMRVTRNLTSAELHAPRKQFKKVYDQVAAALIDRVDPTVIASVSVARTNVTPFCAPLVDELAEFKRRSTLPSAKVKRQGYELTQRVERGADFEMRRYTSVMGTLRDNKDGPGIPNESLSLALFLVPELLRFAIAAKQTKMEDATGREYLTEEDLLFFQAGRNLVTKPSGYVYQNRELLLPRLLPIEGFLTAERIAEIRRNWKAACAEAHEEYGDLQGNYRSFAGQSVNRRRAVDALMKLDDPLIVFDILNKRMAENLCRIDDTSHRWKIHLSDCVLARIEADCGFRSSTLSLLDIDELCKTPSGWVLRVPRSKFKNPNGPYFKVAKGKYRDFERKLTDDNGSYAMFEIYKSVIWPTLPDTGNPALFKNLSLRASDALKAGYPRLAPKTFSERFKSITGAHLRDAIDGIEGLVEFTTHHARALLCCGVLKRGEPKYGPADAMKYAAAAICDGVDVAQKFYVQWSKDKEEAGLMGARAPITPSSR